MPAKPTTHDEYLAPLPDDQRAALQRLRETIHAVAPEAEECISYGLAAFRLDGMLVGYGATKKHCAFYLMSSTVLAEFAETVAALDISKGTIRFQPGAPLPKTLVRKLVRARLAENRAAKG